MNWGEDLIALSSWAMEYTDIKYRYLMAASPKEIASSPGIVNCLETSVVSAILEAALGKGYQLGATILHETPYPGQKGKNPQRADLAFKERGRGKNWVYVEVKYWGAQGKGLISKDIEKLRSIHTRCQRWLLMYRVRANGNKQLTLEKLIQRSFAEDMEESHGASFPTVTQHSVLGICELCLCRLR